MLPSDEPSWFTDLVRKLLIADLATQLPGTAQSPVAAITADDARRLLGRASVLSLSDEQPQRAIAYEIATRLIELSEGRVPGLVSAADLILSRIGNFPGRSLLRKRYVGRTDGVPAVPARLKLERIGRELENTVTGPDQKPWLLTDFQNEFLSELERSTSVSVSAPTSAGKSFVLGLDLVRRIRKSRPACVVYVVPTRALIREVTMSIRDHLRRAEMGDIPVRSVPFPISQERAPKGAVFVLTQERLLSLLHSRDGHQWITTLVVDEAQSIRDEARGIILQTAIEAVVAKHPRAEVHFASPLASNPEFLLDVIARRATGRHFVRTLSPVSQNLILVSEVGGKPSQAQFHLVGGPTPLELGTRELGFPLRGKVFEQRANLARAITRDDEITLLYCNKPSNTEELAEAIVDSQKAEGTVNPNDSDIQELIEFVQADLHDEYPLVKTLPHRVAFHYAFMPAIVRARVEDLCRDGKLKFVCCTSTLLQGVNLPVRHIVIENPKRGSDGMPRADFLNLAGRAGRLLKEFHGNVWCVRPTDWKVKAYDGESLTEIRSAMNEAMADGGIIIQQVLNNELSDKKIDYGEAALGKVYCDFVREKRDLAESQWKTDKNAIALEATAAAIKSLQVTLPTEVLDANRFLRPDRLQRLHDVLKEQPSLDSYIPRIPRDKGAYARLEAIVKVLYEVFVQDETKLYRRWAWLASCWILNTPLSKIIADELAKPPYPDGPQKASGRISKLLEHIEYEVRFRLVKYFMAYSSVLALVLRERGDADAADALEPFHVYLECGASDRIALNLIALGLSRATALALRDKVRFPDGSSPEDCLAKLASTDLAKLAIPTLCLRELKDLLGRK